MYLVGEVLPAAVPVVALIPLPPILPPLTLNLLRNINTINLNCRLLISEVTVF